MKYIFTIVTAVCLISCSREPRPTNQKPLARVFETYLYPGDLEGVVPPGMTGDDSISLVNDFIEKWIRNQLLLHIAENNLTEQEKDVAKQIENYRSSLLIYAYQQSYIQLKLDTVVNESEIETYYKENQANFILNESMIKGLFIKLPVNSPELYKLRQWYHSDNPEDMKSLEGYCFRHAAIYDQFDEGWVDVNEVVRMIPADDQILLNTLKNRKHLEIRDQNYYYFVSAKDLAIEGSITPYELVKNDIHTIILNKRRVRLISELESNVYTDAQNREHFTIYK